MRLTAVLEQRYDRTPDGQVWTPGAHDFAFWQRYLDVFDEVRVVARLREVGSVDAHWRPAGGAGITFCAVPYFIGPLQYLRVMPGVRRVIGQAVRDPQAGAVLLRLPGTLSNVAFAALRNRPFAAEVVGDPHDLYAPGALRHPLRPLIRASATRQLRAQCRAARVVTYVTRQALQARYPAGGRSFALSDVDLPPDAYAGAARRWQAGPKLAVMVCTLQSNYKGVDTMLAALKLLRDQGQALRLRVVGEGALRFVFEAQATTLGLSDSVQFLGAVPGGAGVRAQLDQGDLFVMPSRQEGLPRALVEAMARGLPAVASRIGGIPELLDDTELVLPDDPAALARAVTSLLTNEQRYNAQAQRNLAVSRQYSNAALGDERRRFYLAVRDAGR